MNHYGVRSLTRFESDNGSYVYEERVTLWRAESHRDAIAKCESASREYADELHGTDCDLYQSYEMTGPFPKRMQGAEVFSLMRDSPLGIDDYVHAFFDQGDEHQATVV